MTIRRISRALGAMIICTVAACSPGDEASGPRARAEGRVGVNLIGGGCAVSFAMTVTEQDPELAEDGLPLEATEDVSICQTWTGSDYQYQVVTTTDTENSSSSVPDTVQSVAFSGGQLLAGEAAGNLVAQEPIDATLFDAMNAPQYLRDASYDDPYYGVTGGGGGGGLCPDPTQIICSPQPALIEGGSTTLGGRFERHGITRRGVRAQLDQSEELPALVPALRRFRVQRGEVTTEHHLDRQSQLLIREIHEAPGQTLTVTHEWQESLSKRPPQSRAPWPNFVRRSTSIEARERVGDEIVLSRTTIKFRRVVVNGVALSR